MSWKSLNEFYFTFFTSKCFIVLPAFVWLLPDWITISLLFKVAVAIRVRVTIKSWVARAVPRTNSCRSVTTQPKSAWRDSTLLPINPTLSPGGRTPVAETASAVDQVQKSQCHMLIWLSAVSLMSLLGHYIRRSQKGFTTWYNQEGESLLSKQM